MDDLEVAFQGDDHQTHYPSRHPDGGESSALEDDTDQAVHDRVPVVNIAVCDHGDEAGHREETGEQIHGGLVGDQGMNAAAKLTTCTKQDCKNDCIGTAAHTADNRTDCSRSPVRL